MTDEITAKIAAKGTKATGITEDDARALHRHLGTKRMAIVELTSSAKTEKADGSESVTINIVNVELAPTPATEDHLRELQRAFYYERQLEDGQRALDASIEPKVNDVLMQGERFRPHPFLPTDAALANPLCEVCGNVQNTTSHTEYSDQLALTLPDQDDDDEVGVDEADEPHTYTDPDDNGVCRVCDRDQDDPVHVPDDHQYQDAGANVTPFPALADPFTPTSA